MILNGLPAASSRPWRGCSLQPRLCPPSFEFHIRTHGVRSSQFHLQPRVQCLGRSAALSAVQVLGRLNAIPQKHNGVGADRDDQRSTSAASVLVPRRRARTSGGRSSTNGREDSDGAGRGEARSPDPASPPAQVRGPGSAASSGVAVKQHTEEQAARRRAGGPGRAALSGGPPRVEGVREEPEQHTEERAARGRAAGGHGGASVTSRKLGAGGEEEKDDGREEGPSSAAIPRTGAHGRSRAMSDRPVPTVPSSGWPREPGGRGGGGRGASTSGSGRGGAWAVSGAERGRAQELHSTAGGPAAGATGDAPRSGTPCLGEVSELSELAAIIEQHAEGWAAARSMGGFVAAFTKLAKLATRAGADPDLGRRAFRTLAAAYLPLVPGSTKPVECAIPLWASAKMEVWGDGRLARELLRRLGQQGAGGQPGMLQTARAQEHANLWWALSRDAPSELVEEAEGVLLESAACLQRMGPKQLNDQGCANVLISCARLGWQAEPALVLHLTSCLAAMPDASCQALANAFYSLGELAEDCSHQPRFQDLEGLSKQVMARLEGQGSGRGADQKARPGQRAQPGGQENKHSFKPQELSNTLLGCAKLQYREPELLQPLAAAAGQAAHRFSSQDLANSLYALAKLGCTGAEYAPAVTFLSLGAVQLLRQARERFKPQELSNLLWALERLRPEGSQEYARALLEECMGRGLSGFTPQGLSNILLALEGLRPEGVGTYAQAVAEECRRRGFAGFKPQDFSNSVWALAKMDAALAARIEWIQGWYEAAVQAAMRPGAMYHAKPQAWSNLLYGLALVRHRPAEGLLRGMAEGGQQGPLGTLRAAAESQNCANLLWALAVLGLWSEQGLVDALAGRLGELLRREPSQLVGQDLANSLWALGVMGPEVLAHRHGALVGQLLREVADRLRARVGPERACFTGEELSQLRQVQLELELEYAAAQGDGRLVRGLAAVLATASLVKNGPPAGDCNTSRLQREVARSLTILQQKQKLAGEIESACVAITSVRQEYEVEDLGCRVDVLVELAGGRRVALEVDGPWHFLANPPYTRVKDGRTQLRDRQLESVFGAGNVMSVPYWEWGELRGSARRQEYLARLLGLG